MRSPLADAMLKISDNAPPPKNNSVLQEYGDVQDFLVED